MSTAEQTARPSPGPRRRTDESIRPVPPGELLQRVLLPPPAGPADVRALYLDEPTRPCQRLNPCSRTSARVPEQCEVSFGAYLNAFAASYWRHWTVLTTVHLRLELEGAGRVDVYRTGADGARIFERGERLSGLGRHVLDLELDLRPFEDGGWYWFDLATEAHELTLHFGGWYAAQEGAGRAAVTIGMPTFNRPEDCVATLSAIGGDPLLLAAVTKVIIPDQGTDKIRDQAGFGAVEAVLGDKLRIIDQPNLGGSGGYARVMYEALGSTDCEQILFMDDDIVLEPDAVLRAVAFSRYAREAVLVGGQMLSTQARSQLNTMGEVVDRTTFLWRNAPSTEPHHDLAEQTLQRTAWLHRRVDVDYNAWWMCLIPRAVAEDIGLPLPLFIKWDDAEYGLRARAGGYPTVTVPGIAIWHMSFAGKDVTADWQGYFFYRNRLVAAAVHGPENPRAMLADSIQRTVRHLMLMEYSAVALQSMALRDFLAGPEELFPMLPTMLGEVRSTRARYDDGRPVDPAVYGVRPGLSRSAAQTPSPSPTGRLAMAKAVLRSVVLNLRAPDPRHLAVPQRSVSASEARWSELAGLDSALVTTSDGQGATFRRRDPRLTRAMVKDAVSQHRKIAKEWPGLRRRYREALPELTSCEGWKAVFDR